MRLVISAQPPWNWSGVCNSGKSPAAGACLCLQEQRAKLLLGVLPFPGAGCCMKDAGVTTWPLISWANPSTLLVLPSVGICKKAASCFFPSWKMVTFWLLWPYGEWAVAGEGPSGSVSGLTQKFSGTSARSRRVGRMWTSAYLSSEQLTGHGSEPQGKPDLKVGQPWRGTAAFCSPRVQPTSVCRVYSGCLSQPYLQLGLDCGLGQPWDGFLAEGAHGSTLIL